MTTRRTLAAILATSAIVAAFVAGHVAGSHQDWRCSAEDSCTIDYRHGSWHIAPEDGWTEDD